MGIDDDSAGSNSNSIPGVVDPNETNAENANDIDDDHDDPDTQVDTPGADIPGVNIANIPDPPGVVDEPLPGVEDKLLDSESDSDNDGPDRTAQWTRGDRVVRSTQDEDFVYNTVGIDTLQVIDEPD